MSYPRLESGPAPAAEALPPSQAEIDEATRRRTFDAFHRVLARLTGDVARDWQHCGKAACLRSRRCRGFACGLGVSGDDAAQV